MLLDIRKGRGMNTPEGIGKLLVTIKLCFEVFTKQKKWAKAFCKEGTMYAKTQKRKKAWIILRGGEGEGGNEIQCG